MDAKNCREDYCNSSEQEMIAVHDGNEGYLTLPMEFPVSKSFNHEMKERTSRVEIFLKIEDDENSQDSGFDSGKAESPQIFEYPTQNCEKFEKNIIGREKVLITGKEVTIEGKRVLVEEKIRFNGEKVMLDGEKAEADGETFDIEEEKFEISGNNFGRDGEKVRCDGDHFEIDKEKLEFNRKKVDNGEENFQIDGRKNGDGERIIGEEEMIGKTIMIDEEKMQVHGEKIKRNGKKIANYRVNIENNAEKNENSGGENQSIEDILNIGGEILNIEEENQNGEKSENIGGKSQNTGDMILAVEGKDENIGGNKQQNGGKDQNEEQKQDRKKSEIGDKNQNGKKRENNGGKNQDGEKRKNTGGRNQGEAKTLSVDEKNLIEEKIEGGLKFVKTYLISAPIQNLIPLSEIIKIYNKFCIIYSCKPLTPNILSRIITNVHKSVQRARLGSRGNQKVCFGGLKWKNLNLIKGLNSSSGFFNAPTCIKKERQGEEAEEELDRELQQIQHRQQQYINNKQKKEKPQQLQEIEGKQFKAIPEHQQLLLKIQQLKQENQEITTQIQYFRAQSPTKVHLPQHSEQKNQLNIKQQDFSLYDCMTNDIDIEEHDIDEEMEREEEGGWREEEEAVEWRKMRKEGVERLNEGKRKGAEEKNDRKRGKKRNGIEEKGGRKRQGEEERKREKEKNISKQGLYIKLNNRPDGDPDNFSDIPDDREREEKIRECKEAAGRLSDVLRKFHNNNKVDKVLECFAHSSSCKMIRCNAMCLMFRRIRRHIAGPGHLCVVLEVYTALLRAHISWCTSESCDLPSCPILRTMREERRAQQVSYDTLKWTQAIKRSETKMRSRGNSASLPIAAIPNPSQVFRNRLLNTNKAINPTNKQDHNSVLDNPMKANPIPANPNYIKANPNPILSNPVKANPNLVLANPNPSLANSKQRGSIPLKGNMSTSPTQANMNLSELNPIAPGANPTISGSNPVLSNPVKANPILNNPNLSKGDCNPIKAYPNHTLANPDPIIANPNSILADPNPILSKSTPKLTQPNPSPIPTPAIPNQTNANPKQAILMHSGQVATVQYNL